MTSVLRQTELEIFSDSIGIRFKSPIHQGENLSVAFLSFIINLFVNRCILDDGIGIVLSLRTTKQRRIPFSCAKPYLMLVWSGL